MARASLFLLLVLGVPAGVYWAGNGFSFDALPTELRELRATLPETRPATPATEPPAPRVAPTPAPQPAQPAPVEAPNENPPPPEAPPTSVPAENPREKAERLFREGRFADAAVAFKGVDDQQRALALLGDAFVHAFPPGLPKGRYVLVRTRTGEKYEGFGETEGGLLKIVDAAGRSFSFPESALSEKQEFSQEEARERIARQALDSTDVAGPRIFALIQAACAAGRPDAAASLLEPALDADGKDPYFLSAVRSRVPGEWQKDMYVAFATAQAPAVMNEEPIVRVPPRLAGRRDTAPVEAPKVKNPDVRALMEEAAPYRKRGEQLYKEVVLKGADASTLDTVNEAIAAFDKALALYDKAVEIEESDLLYSLMQSSSRLNFHLRFWKQQIEAR